MPDFGAQFRSCRPDYARVYMGGTAMQCGQHPSLPKRHRWGAWRVFVMPNPDYIGRDRTCQVCSLVDDTQTKLRRKDGAVKW